MDPSLIASRDNMDEWSSEINEKLWPFGSSHRPHRHSENQDFEAAFSDPSSISNNPPSLLQATGGDEISQQPNAPSGLPDNGMFEDSSLPWNLQMPEPLHNDISAVGGPPFGSATRGLPRKRSRYLRNNRGQSPARFALAAHIQGSQLAPFDRMRRRARSTTESRQAAADSMDNYVLGSPSAQGMPLMPDDRWSYREVDGTTANLASSLSENSSASSLSTASTRPSRPATRKRGPQRKPPKPGTGGRRLFQCTFCCDSFRTKYDWSRHETSLHLSPEKWICTPHGGVVFSPSTGRSHCAYCNMLDPSSQHLETHSHDACHPAAGFSKSQHQFSRKDHLVQHLRLVHHLDTLPIIDGWKFESAAITSRCGFCNLRLQSWTDRVEHLAQHFNAGATMDEWQGDHGFEPSIQGQVQNALPPYTLGAEWRSFVPYSASSSASRDHMLQMQAFYQQAHTADDDNDANEYEGDLDEPLAVEGARAPQHTAQPNASTTRQSLDETSYSSVQFLTLGLARFARRQMKRGISPTDDMYQEEARRLIYGHDADGWEQTIADNQEWLDSFRFEHLNM